MHLPDARFDVVGLEPRFGFGATVPPPGCPNRAADSPRGTPGGDSLCHSTWQSVPRCPRLAFCRGAFAFALAVGGFVVVSRGDMDRRMGLPEDQPQPVLVESRVRLQRGLRPSTRLAFAIRRHLGIALRETFLLGHGKRGHAQNQGSVREIPNSDGSIKASRCNALALRMNRHCVDPVG